MQETHVAARDSRLLRVALVSLLAVAFVAGLAGWASAIHLFSDVIGEHDRSEAFTGVPDYVAFLAAGDMIASGEGAQIYDLDTTGAYEEKITLREPGPQTTMPFRNPAFVALPFVPLSQLSFAQALIVLAAVEVLLTFLVIAMGMQVLEPSTKLGRLVFLFGALSFFPLAINVTQGQFSALLCLAYLGLVVAELKGRPVVGGVALAVLLVKPQYVVLPVLWLLVRRRWQTLRSFAVVATVLAAVSVAVVGIGQIDAYPRALLESRHWVDIYAIHPSEMYGWSGFFAQFVEYGSPLHTAITLVVTLATLAVIARIWLAGPRDEAGMLRGAAATLLGSMLVTPHINLHDLSLLLVVLVCGAAYLQRARGLTPVDALLPGLMALLLALGPNLLNFRLGNLYTPLEAVALIGLYYGVSPKRTVEQLPAYEFREAA